MFLPNPLQIEEATAYYRKDAKMQLPQAGEQFQIAYAIKIVRAVKKQPLSDLFKNSTEQHLIVGPGPVFQRKDPDNPILWRQIMGLALKRELRRNEFQNAIGQIEKALEQYRFSHRIDAIDPETIPETLPKDYRVEGAFRAGIERVLADEGEDDPISTTNEILLSANREPLYAIEIEAVLEQLRNHIIVRLHQQYYQESAIEEPKPPALSILERDCRDYLLQELDLEHIIPFDREEQNRFCIREEEESRYAKHLQQYRHSIERKKNRLTVRVGEEKKTPIRLLQPPVRSTFTQ